MINYRVKRTTDALSTPTFRKPTIPTEISQQKLEGGDGSSSGGSIPSSTKSSGISITSAYVRHTPEELMFLKPPSQLQVIYQLYDLQPEEIRDLVFNSFPQTTSTLQCGWFSKVSVRHGSFLLLGN
jgi:hypothetical protein